ncbi:MAG: YfiR family protein [Planctomycetota bacterium]
MPHSSRNTGRASTRRGLLKTLAAAVTLGAAALAAPQPRAAAERDQKEYQLKAAYLYNFANFVEWPAARFEKANSPIVIGVVGEDPFGPILERTFRDKKVGKRGFEFRRFKSVKELAPCHMLFVSRSEKRDFAAIVEHCRPRSILTVTDGDGFMGRGAVINFFIEKKIIRFEVQTDEAKRFKLSVSAKLLQLARVVRDRTPGGGE